VSGRRGRASEAHVSALETAASHCDDIGWSDVAQLLREIVQFIERCPNCGHLISSPMGERHDAAGKACELCAGRAALKEKAND